jgi:hypothetical protein
MDATYIIFKKLPLRNTPIWVETVQGLEKGKSRLMHYSSSSTEEYFLFDVSQARVLDVLAKAKRRAG